MLIRISLIIAIVAGLAAVGIGFVKVKEKIITTMNERDQEKKDKEKTPISPRSSKESALSPRRIGSLFGKKDKDKVEELVATHKKDMIPE